jgi:hypothetical protein
MQTFLLRRWWLFRRRIFSTMTFVVALPIIIHLALTLGIGNIILETITKFSYQKWLYPGLVLIVNTIVIIPIIYREFFDLRVNSRTLITLSLTPLTKLQLIGLLLLTALAEATVFSMVAMTIFLYLMDLSLSILDLLYILVAMNIFGLIVSNGLITISLLTDRINTFFIVTFIFFFFIIFSSELLFEFQFYPFRISAVFENLPTSMVSNWCRSLMFNGNFYWTLFITPLGIGLVWIIFNSVLLKRKLRQ